MNNLEYISYQLFAIYCPDDFREQKIKAISWNDFLNFSKDCQALPQSKIERIFLDSIQKYPLRAKDIKGDMTFEAFYYSIQQMAKATYPTFSTPCTEFVNHFLIPLLIIHGENEEGANLLELLKPMLMVYSNSLKQLYNHFRVYTIYIIMSK